jgi:hypothetical protein
MTHKLPSARHHATGATSGRTSPTSVRPTFILAEGGKIVLAVSLGIAVAHAIVSLLGITFGLAPWAR